MKAGICWHNGMTAPPSAHEALKVARLEHLKVMSLSFPPEIRKLQEAGQDVIVRVYDSRFGGDRNTGHGWHPSPFEYADTVLDAIADYPTVKKFQLHNEPNHLHHVEGWGADDYHARDFNEWLIKVIKLVRRSASRPVDLIFPGLAIPHNDLAWLSICKESILQCDGLGVHLYWQNRFENGQWVTQNHLHPDWGLKYRYYKARFPDMPLYCLEAGNSNGQNRHDPRLAPFFPINHEKYGHEYNELIAQATSDGQLESIAFFIMSSEGRGWQDDGFVFVEESGKILPVAHILGQRP